MFLPKTADRKRVHGGVGITEEDFLDKTLVGWVEET